MQILLIEDEALAAKKLNELLSKYFGSPNTKWLKSVDDSLSYLNTHDMPDLIISDIELLDGNVFSLFEQFKIKCPIIFVTAYDQFLLQAFKTNGIAYVLKPFDEEEFNITLDKYNQLFGNNKKEVLPTKILQDLKNALNSSQKEYKNRFVIKKASGIFLLSAKDVVYFQADSDIVFAFDNQQTKHIVQHRLSELEDMLDPNKFFRINRGEIIHIDYIKNIEPYFNNRLVVNLTKAKEGLKTSTSKTAAFRKWIE